jgi:DNA polymerase-3 subunit delta
MITLLCGDDAYRISSRELALKQGFPSNDLNVNTFENDLNLALIKSATNTIPFLSDSKLVIINGLSQFKDKASQTAAKDWLKELPNFTELILVEGELTPKNWLMETIRSLGKVEIFNTLRPYEVIDYIKNKVQEGGGYINQQAAEKLSFLIGNDLNRIDNEINKLLTFNPSIDIAEVNEMVRGEFNDSIFTLLDAISEKKTNKALESLNGFLESDDLGIYLITMLSRQVRNLLSIKDLLSQGKKDTDIVSKLKLHPYVVKKSISQGKNFSIDQLLAFHQELVDTDASFKSSNVDPKTILIKLIYNLCK